MRYLILSLLLIANVSYAATASWYGGKLIINEV